MGRAWFWVSQDQFDLKDKTRSPYFKLIQGLYVINRPFEGSSNCKEGSRMIVLIVLLV